MSLGTPVTVMTNVIFHDPEVLVDLIIESGMEKIFFKKGIPMRKYQKPLKKIRKKNKLSCKNSRPGYPNKPQTI